MIYANKFAILFAYVKKKQYLCTRFMRRVRIIVFLLAVCAGMVWADDTKKPGFQLEDNTFFDPEKKVEPQAPYVFGMEYRLEIGYVQNWQRTQKITFPDMYLHGARLGATFTFLLPIHFALETGALYTIMYGTEEQHWRSQTAQSVQEEYINHRVLAHNLTVPLRVFYTIPLWKELNLFFYTGPQLHIGLAQNDYMNKHLSAGTEAWLQTIGVATEPYDRMHNELVRANIQWGVGGGLEWDRYRVQSGYDFGLNNLVKHPAIKGQNMTEWGWYVSFCYRL